MNKGYTLIELLIAMTILTIVTLGFFAWASTIIHTNLSTQKNNFALSIAKDIAERLNNLPDNSPLIQPTTSKCTGFDPVTGELKKCTACGSGSLGGNITQDSSGLTEFTNPWDSINNRLYMYDQNACKSKTWLDTACQTNIFINLSANPQIDHPRVPNNYDIISPVRYQNNTTYYAVWSVAYLSCTGETDRRKIFITVYWIDPEPEDTNISDVQAKIATGTYTLKTVSIVTDKIIGLIK